MKAIQKSICETYSAEYIAAPFLAKAGVARDVGPGALVLNGLRHPATNAMSGWFIWAGEHLGSGDDFFEPLHIEHLIERCPIVLKYLGLASGWRFLVAPDYEEVWFDAHLLRVI